MKNCPQRCVGFFQAQAHPERWLGSDALVSLGLTPGFIAEEGQCHRVRLNQAEHPHIRLFQLQVGKPLHCAQCRWTVVVSTMPWLALRLLVLV